MVAPSASWRLQGCKLQLPLPLSLPLPLVYQGTVRLGCRRWEER